MADLTSLSRQHSEFYSPAFSVKVGGQDLPRKLGIAVSQVEADRVLGGMGRFSFTVVDSYSLEDRTFLSRSGDPVLQLLKFGASVEIAMGYGGHADLSVVLRGMITEITTNFPESGVPELAIAGYDHLFPLSLGKRSDSYRDKSDSDVVTMLAGDNQLGAKIQRTSERHPQIEQNQESDLDFIKKLAERNHYEFYVDESKALHFGEANYRGNAVAALSWGQGLLSFQPQANLAGQVSKVAVYGWDKERKQAIVGRASAGEESGRSSGRKSGGEQLKSGLGKDPVLEVRQPVFSEAEAKRRAQAILDACAKKFLTGDAECLGLPCLLPDCSVELGGLGEPFSKTYYIEQATHKIDESGYRTRVKVKEPSL